MRALIARSLVAAALAATAALVSVMVLYGLAPGVTLDMTHAVPSIVGGIYPPERDPSGMPFAWTSGRVEIRLPGLDRRTPWTLTISARAARPDAAMFPRLRVAVDGNVLSTDQLANEPSTIEVTVPSRASAAHDTTIEVTLDQTFVPGNGDARELGAVVTRIALEPVGTAIPPAGLLVGGPLAAASFGAAFALTGLPTLAATAVGAVVALGYAAVVTSGFGAYGSYGLDAARMAVLIAFGTLGIVGLVRQRTALSQAAIAVAAISAGALYLKLIVLLHPAMPVGDALFHAHRFQWVLEGRYYFTSIAPGLYEFPYPVGFYLLASPLVLFTQSAEQYTTLIRVAGTVAQVGAALALYSMVVRAWGDRMVGATAVGMFHLLPLTMGVLGTGNWTNAFAESVAILSLAAVTTAPLRRLSLPVAMGTIAIIALACLSHTSTFAILPTTVILTALLYRWKGDDETRAVAWPVLLATLAAAAAAVLVYYGQFGDVYREQFGRIAGEVGVAGAETSNPNSQTMASRLSYVPVLTALYYGWPVVAITAAGAWHLYQRGSRDRLTLALAGVTISCFGFLVLGVFTPVGMRYFLAGLPAVAIVVAATLVMAVRMPPAFKWATGFMAAWALANSVRGWVGWLT